MDADRSNYDSTSDTAGEQTADASASSPRMIKQPPTSTLAAIWDNNAYFAIASLFGMVVVPFGCFLLIGLWDGNLHLPGDQRGLVDTPSMATVCAVVFLVVVFIRYAIEQQYETFQSFNERTLRFEGDRSSRYLEGDYAEFSSTLTRSELQTLFEFYEFLLAKATFRGRDEISCPPKYAHIYRWFRRLFVLCVAGGATVLAVTTYYHWFAESMYGVDIWASSTYPISFTARFVYEAVVLLLVVPWILIVFILLCFLSYHPFALLRRRNGLRFHRVSLDGVTGFGAFGNQAFKNMLVLSPFALQLVVYAVFLPTTELLIAGMVLLVLAVPTFFLGQLISAHRAMRDARQIELEIIGNAYAENYERYKELLINRDSIGPDGDSRLVAHHESIEKADVVYSQVRNAPAWPFQQSVIAKVASMIATFVSGFGAVLTGGFWI